MTQVDTEEKGNTKPSLRVRRWCFTLNNYTNCDFDTITQEFKSNALYYTIGKEVGDQNGTPHLQGYVEFKNGKTLEGMKKLIPRAHFEIARGKRAQNEAYCIK